MERKEAIEIVRKLYNESLFMKKDKEAMVTLIPELKESEDEKIRKELLEYLQRCVKCNPLTEETEKIMKDSIAWLEKQDEHKLADKIEPKFKVGDWVYHEKSGNKCHINKIENGLYVSDEGATISLGRQNDWRLWTIQDAKDGDVLYSHNNNLLWIYKDKTSYHTSMILDYAQYNCISINCDIVIPLDTCPATKEQCDILFQKMKESGYEWDAEKKELRKIEKKPANEMISLLRTEYEKGRADAIAEMQKPAWSEEDEKMFDSIIEDVMPYGECPDYPTDEEREYFYEGNRKVKWLKSLKERMKGGEE